MKIEAFVLIFFFLTCSSTSHKNGIPPCFESIISFGDSYADTGNFIRLESGSTNLPSAARPPYGRTFFHYPTGRYSDGRIIIDFIAERLGLPPIEPYLSGQHENFSSGRFEKGVNFAVAGCVALDVQYFEENGIDIQNTKVTLGVQLNWFKQFLATIPDWKNYIQSSLILLGEIGGNDYNYPILQGKAIDVVKSMVPKVINKIGIIIEELINLGAQTMLVPGNTPFGCLPVFLTELRTTNMTVYDPITGCIKRLNELSKYHNQLLQSELKRIKRIHPHVKIIYADYYNAAMPFYIAPEIFGFTAGALEACCGFYTYNNVTKLVLNQNANCCDDPFSFVSWDGLHLTEAAYHLMAQPLLEAHFLTTCISDSSQSGSFFQ